MSGTWTGVTLGDLADGSPTGWHGIFLSWKTMIFQAFQILLNRGFIQFRLFFSERRCFCLVWWIHVLSFFMFCLLMFQSVSLFWFLVSFCTSWEGRVDVFTYNKLVKTTTHFHTKVDYMKQKNFHLSFWQNIFSLQVKMTTTLFTLTLL